MTKTLRKQPTHNLALKYQPYTDVVSLEKPDLPEPGLWRTIGRIAWSTSTKTLLGTVQVYAADSPDDAIATHVEWQPPAGACAQPQPPVGSIVKVTPTTIVERLDDCGTTPFARLARRGLEAAGKMPAAEATPPPALPPLDVLAHLCVQNVPEALTTELARCITLGGEYGLFAHCSRDLRCDNVVAMDLTRRRSLDARDVRPLARLFTISGDGKLMAWEVGKKDVVVVQAGMESPVSVTVRHDRRRTITCNADCAPQLPGLSDAEEDAWADRAPLPEIRAERVTAITTAHGIESATTTITKGSTRLHDTVTAVLNAIAQKSKVDDQLALRAERRVERCIDDPSDSPWIRGREKNHPDEWSWFCADVSVPSAAPGPVTLAPDKEEAWRTQQRAELSPLDDDDEIMAEWDAVSAASTGYTSSDNDCYDDDDARGYVSSGDDCSDDDDDEDSGSGDDAMEEEDNNDDDNEDDNDAAADNEDDNDENDNDEDKAADDEAAHPAAPARFDFPTSFEEIKALVERANALAEEHERLVALHERPKTAAMQ